MNKSNLIAYATAIFLTVFALLSLYLSSSVIFDLFGIRAKEGNYVLIVVWTNFISSILYLFAAYGFIKLKTWTYKPLIISVIFLTIGFIGLYTHIIADGLYESKTIGVMLFRITLTLAFTVLAYLKFKK
jgi:ABC-type glycerol-3-phosphate transport system permease component